MNLEKAIAAPRWSPRSTFPPSEALVGRLFTCGGGFYLMTNPDFGDGDPVYAVGWAESDHWARRAWERPPYAGDLTPPAAQWKPPSLLFLGLPEDLSYASVYSFETARCETGAQKASLIGGSFRLTDGAFLHRTVKGAPGSGISYIYAAAKPTPKDPPVALEFMLPEHP